MYIRHRLSKPDIYYYIQQVGVSIQDINLPLRSSSGLSCEWLARPYYRTPCLPTMPDVPTQRTLLGLPELFTL